MEMSKGERRRLRREMRKEQAQKEIGRKNMFGKIKIMTIPIIVFIAIAGYLYVYSAPVEGAPVMGIESTTHNFGTVNRFNGIVSTDFKIKNTGDNDLIMMGMDTSCMCTKASIVTNNVEGPKFGMAGHGINPMGWSTPIKPNEEATLRVYYDPNVHPDLTGRVTRTVNVYSNDPKNPVSVIRIDLNQI
ncbi:MAG: DUF1573 domain-containing protein [Candidatus Aenigmatarchaeota archaeon]